MPKYWGLSSLGLSSLGLSNLVLSNLVLISSFAIASTVNFASTAIAETGTVTFSGTVLPQASLSDPVVGKVEPVSTLGSRETSNDLHWANTTQISLQTHKPVNISISSPVDIQNNITLSFGSESAIANGESVSLPPGNTNLEMNTSLEKPEALVGNLAPSNNRTYSLTITLTP